MNNKKSIKEINILYEIKSLEQLIIKEILFKNNNKNLKYLSPTTMKIIEYIVKNENKKIYQKDLEDILKLSRATISEVLKTMEKNDMIKRFTSKNDTRRKEIKLSKTTKEFYEINKRKIIELEKTITKNISKNELKTFNIVINKMKENIQNMSNDKNLNIKIKGE